MNNSMFEEAVNKAQLGGIVLSIFGKTRENLEKILENSTKEEVIALYAMTLTDLILAREHKTEIGTAKNILREAGIFQE